MKPRIQITISLECAGAHHGQTDMILRSYALDGTQTGWVMFTVFRGLIHLDSIEVKPFFRRLGVALAMVNYLAKEHGPDKIAWGYLSKAGAGLYRAYLRQFPLDHRINLRAGLVKSGRKNSQVDEQVVQLLSNSPHAAPTWSRAA